LTKISLDTGGFFWSKFGKNNIREGSMQILFVFSELLPGANLGTHNSCKEKPYEENSI
jgi:hypothetical protein